MNSHPNLVSSANWQSRDLHSSPVIFLRGGNGHILSSKGLDFNVFSIIFLYFIQQSVV